MFPCMSVIQLEPDCYMTLIEDPLKCCISLMNVTMSILLWSSKLKPSLYHHFIREHKHCCLRLGHFNCLEARFNEVNWCTLSHCSIFQWPRWRWAPMKCACPAFSSGGFEAGRLVYFGLSLNPNWWGRYRVQILQAYERALFVECPETWLTTWLEDVGGAPPKEPDIYAY